MTRFVLKFRELCVLTGLLGLGGLLLLISMIESSSWKTVLTDIDVSKTEILPEVTFVAEYPITDISLQNILADKTDLKTFPITVENSGVNGKTPNSFRDQVVEGFSKSKEPLPYDLLGQEYAFYVDVPNEKLKRFSNSYLYYYLVMDDYKLFIDGNLVRKVDARRGDIGAVQILPPKDPGKDFVRIVWLCKNTRVNKIAGLFYKYGLSIRSGEDVVETLEFEQYRTQFPHTVSSVSLFIIAIIAFGFAFSAKGFLDIWAFGAFTMAMGLFIWAQTPVFYWSWGWEDGGRLLGSVKGVIAALVVLFATILTMAFFRMEGRHIRISDISKYFKGKTILGIIKESTDVLNHPFRMMLISTTAIAGVILYTHFPLFAEQSRPAEIAINQKLSYLLFVSQCLAFFFGYRSLFRIRRKFIEKDLTAQVKLIHKRIATSFVFTIGMGIMVIAFLKGLKGVTDALETDLVLLAAIFPASAMLLMFFWMVSSANRFYQKFSPRLGQIDHEVLAFGEAALQKRYYGCLLVFDLKGMKKLNMVRSKSRECEEAVDKLIYNVEHSLSDLIQRGRITFKYKSNGDEFIFNMRAKDEAEAVGLMVELTDLWQKCSEKYLAHWRSELERDLYGFLSEVRIANLVDALDIHVLITTLRDMKITIKGGIDKPTANPDFMDARFTALTSVFKPTRHNRIAMYRDDAELYLAKVSTEAQFIEDHKGIGFLEFSTTLNAVDKAG